MILDTSLKLEAVLSGAVTASQPEVHVDYVDWNQAGEMTVPAITRTALNGVADVTILAAPTGNPKREAIYVSIYNKDTSPVTITVKTDDGTTERIIVKQAISVGETFQYVKGIGWFRQAVV